MKALSVRKQILRHFIRHVWDEGRADDAGRYLAAAYKIHHDPGDPWDGQTLGLDEYIDRVRRSRAPFPDQRFDIVRLFEDGDAVVMTWHWSATHRGEIAGFAPTGNAIHMSGATAYFFDDEDRIGGHWQISDRLGIFLQLQSNRAAVRAMAHSNIPV